MAAVQLNSIDWQERYKFKVWTYLEIRHLWTSNSATNFTYVFSGFGYWLQRPIINYTPFYIVPYACNFLIHRGVILHDGG